MVSIMSFETQNSAGGSREAITREISPKTTTVRPDSHTKRSTAGTLRRAESRSRHPPQNSDFPLMTESTCKLRWYSVRHGTSPSANRNDATRMLVNPVLVNPMSDEETAPSVGESTSGKLRPAHRTIDKRRFDEETAHGVGSNEKPPGGTTLAMHR